MTSRDIVDRVVRLVRPAKAGHAGTLDPLATGVLVVCVGHATRLINLIQEGRKRYLARFILGQSSDTDDVTGNVTVSGDWSRLTKEQIDAALPAFTGRIQQVPPCFSAVHVKGRRAYDLARRGETVELNARPVEVFSLRMTDFQPPEFELEIECGSGTYIRSIGRDLGVTLGCGALMTSLRRLSVGAFDVNDAVSYESLTAETIDDFLHPATSIVSNLRQRTLVEAEIIAVRRGQTIDALLQEGVRHLLEAKPAIAPVDDSHSSNSRQVKTNDSQALDNRTALLGADGELIGIGEIDSITQRVHPRIVFPMEVVE